MNDRRGRAWVVMLVAVIAAAALGVAAGVRWHEDVSRMLHGHQAEPASPQKKQVWTCSMHPQVLRDGPGLCPICHMQLTPLSQGSAAAGVVEISPTVVQNMGVRTAEVVKGTLTQEVRAAGYLEEAQPNIHDVTLRVSGWVEKLYADAEGMHVQEGDRLFDLYSAELQVGIEEAIAARKGWAEVRAEAGVEEKAAAESLYESAARKLELWGLARDQVDKLSQLTTAPRTVTFTSPVTGHVVEKPVVAGAAVKAGDRVLRIVDHTSLWLEARLPERDLGLVKVGQRAAGSVVTGQAIEGQIVLIHPHVDDATRTGRVRLLVGNEDLRLRPGMYASMNIAWRAAEESLLVPRDAVIETGERQIVFLSLGQGRFEPREVKTGHAGEGGVVEVVSGLAAGDMVVVSGQFLLDSESRLREAVRKYTAGEPAAVKPVEAGPAPKRTVVEVKTPAEMAARVDDVFAAYLTISEALGALQTKDTPVDPQPLVVASWALHSAAKTTEGKDLVMPVFKAAQGLAGRTIDVQRERFMAVSEAVLKLARVHPPSKKVAASLYVMYCPMVQSHWLQKGPMLANPYYPNTMKDCGEIEETIEGKP